MQSYRMLVTDLDRTALDRKGNMHPDTACALAQCRARGMALVYATARPVRTLSGLPVQADYVLANNGATIVQGSAVLREKNITRAQAQALVDACMACPDIACVGLEDGTSVQTTYQGPPWGPGWNAVYTRFESGVYADTPKLTVQCDSEMVVSAVMADFPELRWFGNQGEDWYQIQRKDVDKGLAVAWLAEALGIPMSQVLAFGDDVNDVAMLGACGMGVAVGNAAQAALDIADAVCGHHDEQGVAQWIFRHVLGE